MMFGSDGIVVDSYPSLETSKEIQEVADKFYSEHYKGGLETTTDPFLQKMGKISTIAQRIHPDRLYTIRNIVMVTKMFQKEIDFNRFVNAPDDFKVVCLESQFLQESIADVYLEAMERSSWDCNNMYKNFSKIKNGDLSGDSQLRSMTILHSNITSLPNSELYAGVILAMCSIYGSMEVLEIIKSLQIHSIYRNLWDEKIGEFDIRRFVRVIAALQDFKDSPIFWALEIIDLGDSA